MKFENYQRACGIWEENLPARIETLEKRENQKEAVKALWENNRVVVLLGASEQGKSYLLSARANEILYRNWYQKAYEEYAISNEIVKEGKRLVSYMTFFDYELALRTAMHNGTMEQLFSEMLATQVLIVDELGRGKWSDFTATFFENLIIRRYGEKKITYIGSNLTAKEFVEMFDSAVVRRIQNEKFVVIK